MKIFGGNFSFGSHEKAVAQAPPKAAARPPEAQGQPKANAGKYIGSKGVKRDLQREARKENRRGAAAAGSSSASSQPTEPLTPSQYLFGKSSRQYMQELYGEEPSSPQFGHATLEKATPEEITASVTPGLIDEMKLAAGVHPSKRMARLEHIVADIDQKLTNGGSDAAAKTELLLGCLELLNSLASQPSHGFTHQQMATVLAKISDMSANIGFDSMGKIVVKIAEYKENLLPSAPQSSNDTQQLRSSQS